MGEGILECPICYETYDLAKHIPRVICCGHTLCSSCIFKIISYQSSSTFKCPLDKIEIHLRRREVSCFPVNIVVQALLEELSDTNMCPEHHRKLQWSCPSQNLKLCSKCIGQNRHMGCQIDKLPVELENKFTNKAVGEQISREKIIYKPIEPNHQPSLLVNNAKYEKVERIKNSVINFFEITIALALFLFPFFKGFVNEYWKT